MNELATIEPSAMLLEAYTESLDLKPRSKNAYEKAVRYFLDWTKENGIKAPKRADLLAYKEYLAANYTAATASTYLTAVRSFFNYLNAEAGYPLITNGIKNPKTRPGHKKDALSAGQAKEVLAAIERGTLAGKRDYAIVSLMLHTGLRTIEVSRANIEDLRSVSGAPVLFVWGKGRDSKDEYVKITKTVQEAIADYMAEREEQSGAQTPQSPLFASVSRRDYGQRLTTRSISRISKEALQAAGYDDRRLTAHSYRHTAVTLALQAGVPIRDVQQMARHASPLTTERYAHDIRRIEAAAEDKLEEILAV